MKAAAKGGTVGQCRAEAAHRRSSVHLEEHIDLRQREDVNAVRARGRAGQGRRVQGKDLLSRILVTDPKGGNGGQSGQVSNGQFLKM